MKNPVAKFAHKFNRAKVFTDKVKDYSRKQKHRNQTRERSYSE